MEEDQTAQELREYMQTPEAAEIAESERESERRMREFEARLEKGKSGLQMPEWEPGRREVKACFETVLGALEVAETRSLDVLVREHCDMLRAALENEARCEDVIKLLKVLTRDAEKLRDRFNEAWEAARGAAGRGTRERVWRSPEDMEGDPPPFRASGTMSRRTRNDRFVHAEEKVSP